MKKSISLLSIVAFCCAPAFADLYQQVGPTGELPSTAKVLNGPNSLDKITGTLDDFLSVDLFRIQVPDPASFSAQTIVGDLFFAPVATPILYLFSDSGAPIYADSESGSSRQGFLGKGLPISPTTPGSYLLGITWFGNQPVDAKGHALFQPFPTNYVGGMFQSYAPAAAAGNLANWNFGVTSMEDGPEFQINLTGAVGAPIPEPGTWVFLLTGCAVLAARRRGWGR